MISPFVTTAVWEKIKPTVKSGRTLLDAAQCLRYGSIVRRMADRCPDLSGGLFRLETFEPVVIGAQETMRVMRRIFPLVAVVIGLAPAAGCGGLGLIRSAAHIPGVAATDYAFYNFCGSSTQLYPFSPPQVESSAIEALGDLGFRILEPPSHMPDGPSIIRANAPDGRPAKITISPQNSLTSVRVEIGPIHIGDEELSRDLFRRISANFGTGSRVYTPIDPTLPKRLNVSTGFVPQAEHTPPWQLEGEGLRPNENRDRAAMEESTIPGQESSSGSNLPGLMQGLMPGAGGQRSPFGPGVPNPVPPNPYLPFTLPSNDQDGP